MPRCARKGCGKEYGKDANTEESCTYHPGDPVFHEGLKSWSCCNTINKPVLEFDQFMQIPGCAIGSHLEHVPQNQAPKPTSTTANLTLTSSAEGKESYSTKPSEPSSNLVSRTATPKPEPVVIEEDDLTVPVVPGTQCKRQGCSARFVNDAENRLGDGPGTVCTFHPRPPLFHEGSKGYLCCKRRVLEFEEFLKIGGCTDGRHLFAPKAKSPTTEEFADCRIDHYQTPANVQVSVFAKQVDKERSTVVFESEKIHIDLYLPGGKRFKRSLELFGTIDPDASSFKVLGTKVELNLKKSDGKSWTILEKTARGLGGFHLTFGVGGRTGTVGGKEIIIDPSSQPQSKSQ